MPTLSELLEKTQDLFDKWLAREEEQRTWLTGTATGGPLGDGYYPLTDSTGFTVPQPSPAKMRLIAASLEVISLTGAAQTLTVGQSGNRIRISHSATATITVPSAPVGTIWYPRQTGVGALKFVGASGVTIVNRRGHNGTAGESGGVSLTVESAGVVYLDGDTAMVA